MWSGKYHFVHEAQGAEASVFWQTSLRNSFVNTSMNGAVFTDLEQRDRGFDLASDGAIPVNYFCLDGARQRSVHHGICRLIPAHQGEWVGLRFYLFSLVHIFREPPLDWRARSQCGITPGSSALPPVAVWEQKKKNTAHRAGEVGQGDLCFKPTAVRRVDAFVLFSEPHRLRPLELCQVCLLLVLNHGLLQGLVDVVGLIPGSAELRLHWSGRPSFQAERGQLLLLFSLPDSKNPSCPTKFSSSLILVFSSSLVSLSAPANLMRLRGRPCSDGLRRTSRLRNSQLRCLHCLSVLTALKSVCWVLSDPRLRLVLPRPIPGTAARLARLPVTTRAIPFSGSRSWTFLLSWGCGRAVSVARGQNSKLPRDTAATEFRPCESRAHFWLSRTPSCDSSATQETTS